MVDSSTISDETAPGPLHSRLKKGAVKSFALNSCLSAFVYGGFAVYFQKYYFHWLRSSRNISNIVLIPGLVLVVFLYWRSYRLLKDNRDMETKIVVLSGLLTGLIASTIPSFYSSDLLTYINYGWQQAKYHANPYCLLLAGTAGFGKDPMFTPVWTLVPAVYGFAFAHLTRIVCQIGGGDLLRTIFVLKGVTFLAWLAVGAAVYYGAKKFKVSRPDLSLYLYFFNPLLMLHTLSGGHNDIFMVLPVMAAFLSVEANTLFLTIPLLVVAATIKYVWLIALPFLLLLLLKNFGWKAVVVNVLAGIGVIVGLGWYYQCDWHQVRWQEMFSNLTMQANSLAATVENLLRCLPLRFFSGQPERRADAIALIISCIKVPFIAGFVGLCSWLLYTVCKKRKISLQEALEKSLLLVVVLVCFVSGKFYPWYVVMFFPLCLWLPEDSLLRKVGLTLSLTQLFAVTFIGHGHAANFLLLTATPVFILVLLAIRSKSLRLNHRPN